MRSSVSLASLGLFLAVIGVPSTSGQDGEDNKELTALLERPISPGALAMLIPHTREPRAVARWVTSLDHKNPDVRSAATRLLLVAGARSTASRLQQALTDERDAETALEMARALLVLGGSQADATVIGTGERLADGRLAVAYARARGAAGLAMLGRLRALTMNAQWQTDMVEALVQGSEQHLKTVARVALEAADRSLWLSVLNVASRNALTLDQSTLESALASSSLAIRDLSWWYVATLIADRPKAAAFAPPDPPTGGNIGDEPELAFGREIVGRILTRKATASAALLDKLRKTSPLLPFPTFAVEAVTGPLYRYLTEAERDALNSGRAHDLRIRESSKHETPALVPGYGEYRILRTVGNIPKGLALDLVKQIGCDIRKTTELGGATVAYGDDGTLRAVQFLNNHLSKPCDMAARYLSVIGSVPAPANWSSERSDVIVVPMHEAFLTCLDRGSGRSEQPPMPVQPFSLVPPKKLKHVDPIYPEQALRQGRTGIVVAQAVISPEGCVSEAKILKGAQTDLDFATLWAVTNWSFTPTALNGTAVPVVMNVTLQFSRQ